jgi:hypothetical protein
MEHLCWLRFVPLVAVAALSVAGAASSAGPAVGPLRVHPTNPRYFTGDGKRAVLLTGAHTWNNLQDMGETDPPPEFDWNAYLDFLTDHHHNFVRLWHWELTIWDTKANGENRRHFCAPHPWPRTGPGNALDGKPKFDLSKLDEAYMSRLRSRVESAGKRGIYVSVMLFEGWGMQFVEGAWRAHPFYPDNNVNGIDGDVNGDGKGLEVHELANPKVLAIQETYVRAVIDKLNDLDNVLYEVSNENHPASTEWQYHMIDFIHAYERTKPKQHPVGMTFQYEGGSNETLFASPADWVSPNPEGGYNNAPPANDGRKVILNDTDHLWGIGGNVPWVWKSVCRGVNPLFMDPYDGKILETNPQWEQVRRALGQARAVADRLDLAAMTPHEGLASTGFCLADPGREYLAYAPSGEVTVDLAGANGEFAVEWMHPTEGALTPGEPIAGGAKRTLKAPFAGDAVLRIWGR